MLTSNLPENPVFQIFECVNPGCRLRCPSDLSTAILTTCPFCGSVMVSDGEPYSNYQRAPIGLEKPVNAINLLLDNLRSAENVGSIFRSANGAGVRHIYCCGTTPTPDHARVRKSSLGAEKYTQWSYHKNAIILAQEIQIRGGTFYALESTASSSPLFNFSRSPRKAQPVTLIVGNEISGVDPELLKLSQQVLHIPMVGEKTSLNVAVSTAIALYYLIH